MEMKGFVKEPFQNKTQIIAGLKEWFDMTGEKKESKAFIICDVT